jgi:hypothetical protein
MLLAILPVTVILASFTFSQQYRMFEGRAFDPGFGGIGYFGLIFPSVLVLVSVLTLFGVLKTMTRPRTVSAEHRLLILIYIPILIVLTNPWVLRSLALL